MSISNTFRRKTAIVLLCLISTQALFPVQALALTTGPSQPEVMDFEPVTTTKMVDLFTGDFNYNIPLFELPGPDGGYPFNIAYHSGITMDQEASWVGLGWSLNHGAITRSMRGLPDDFNGEEIERTVDAKPNETWDFSLGGDIEVFGNKIKGKKGKLSPGLSFTYNSYRGWDAGINLGLGSNSKAYGSFNGGINLGVTSTGTSITPNLSFGRIFKRGSLNASVTFGSLEGIKNVSLTSGWSGKIAGKGPKVQFENHPDDEYRKTMRGDLGLTVNGTMSYAFGQPSFAPQVSLPYSGWNFAGNIKVGGWATPAGIGGNLNVMYSKQQLSGKSGDKPIVLKTPAYGYFNSKNRTNGDKFLLDFNREKEYSIKENTTNLAAPVATQDVYAVMGQGVGGSYMAHRSDVGVFTDPYAESKSFGGNLGAELDFGPGFDLGVNAGANWSNSYTDKWEAGGSDAQKANHNEFYERFKYSDNESSKPEYEQYYFTAGGEMSAEPVNTHDNIAGDKAASVVLSGSFPESTRAKHNLTTGLRTRNHGQQYNQDGPVVDVTKPLMRDKRKPRSSSIQFFKNEDAAKMEEFNTASYSD